MLPGYRYVSFKTDNPANSSEIQHITRSRHENILVAWLQGFGRFATPDGGSKDASVYEVTLVRASTKHTFGVRLTESPSDGSVRIRGIASNSPASQAGVPCAGDVLLQLSCVPLPDMAGGGTWCSNMDSTTDDSAVSQESRFRSACDVLKINLEPPGGGIKSLHSQAAVIKRSLKVRYRMRAVSARRQLDVSRICQSMHLCVSAQ